MLRDFQAFQDLFNDKKIEMTEKCLNSLIYKFQFCYVQAGNVNIFDSANIIESNFIVIDEILNYNNTQEDYYILSFILLQKYNLLIIKQSDIHLIQSLITQNKGKQIYYLRKNRNEKLHSIFINYPIENHSIYFDQEITNFNSRLFIKDASFTKFWCAIKCSISGFLIKKSYENSFFERVSDHPIKFESNPIEVKFSEDEFIILRHLNKNYISVKLIYHIQKGKLFVIKFQLDDEDSKLIEREKQNYMNINYLLIPKYYGYGETFGQKYIIIEYINGHNLNEIKKLMLSKSDKISIIYELIAVFQHIHDKGFIYRDLRPDNIMIDKNNTAILIDFDRLIKNPADFTQITVNFAHNYYAPEIVLGSFTNSCDIYSLGLIIYFIMTEKDPIIDLENPSKTLIDFPSEFPELKKICEKCIQKDPNKRHKELYKTFFYYCLFSDEIDIKSKEKVLDVFDNIFIYKNQSIEYSKLLLSIAKIYKNSIVPSNLNRMNKYYEYSANLNNVEAQIMIGEYYYTNQNFNKSIYYLTMAANQNNPTAQYYLGHIYFCKLNEINKGINYLTLASNQNNSNAQIELAAIYLNGKYLKRDIQKVIHLLTLSANQNNEDAQLSLAKMYMKYLIPKNLNKAFHFYKLASQHNNKKAQYYLGIFYENGVCCEKDLRKAIDYFYLSANQNYAKALHQLGIHYYYGIGVRKDINKSIEFFTNAAKQNHINSIYSLGCIYNNGIYVQKDMNKAIRYFSIAAESKHPYSLYNLAVIYYNGEFVKQDINKCINYLSLSANQNIDEAQFLLGKIYIEGIVVRRNVKYGLKYLSLAANQNHKLAQFYLGIFYMDGLFAPRDLDKSIHFFELASNQNFSDATYYLGRVYFIMKKDYNKGIKYFKQASDANNSDAQYTMGIIYFYGLCVEKEVNKALYYFNLSAVLKNKYSQYFLGCLYNEGKHVNYDLNKAIFYFSLAANQNHSESQFCLGCIYINNKNINKALNYFTLAADQNYNKEAQYCLAILYFEGYYVKRDINKAIHYFKETSSFSNQFSKNNLGIIYKMGDGVDKNISMAIEYFNEAIKQKNDCAAMFNLAHIYFYEEDVELDIDKAISLLIKSSLLDNNFSFNLLKLALIKKYKNITKLDIENELKNNGVENFEKIINEKDFLISLKKIAKSSLFNFMYDIYRDIILVYDINYHYMKIDVKNKNNNTLTSNVFKEINKNFYDGFSE